MKTTAFLECSRNIYICNLHRKSVFSASAGAAENQPCVRPVSQTVYLVFVPKKQRRSEKCGRSNAAGTCSQMELWSISPSGRGGTARSAKGERLAALLREGEREAVEGDGCERCSACDDSPVDCRARSGAAMLRRITQGVAAFGGRSEQHGVAAVGI